MMKSVEATGKVQISIVDNAYAEVEHTGGDLIAVSDEMVRMIYDGETWLTNVIDGFSFEVGGCIFYYVGQDLASLTTIYRIFKPE